MPVAGEKFYRLYGKYGKTIRNVSLMLAIWKFTQNIRADEPRWPRVLFPGGGLYSPSAPAYFTPMRLWKNHYFDSFLEAIHSDRPVHSCYLSRWKVKAPCRRSAKDKSSRRFHNKQGFFEFHNNFRYTIEYLRLLLWRSRNLDSFLDNAAFAFGVSDPSLCNSSSNDRPNIELGTLFDQNSSFPRRITI